MRAPMVSILAVLLLAPALGHAQAPLRGRPFGTDDDPPPGAPPSRPRVVMRLDYLRAPGADGCPDEHVVRASVAAQVRRWDPFAPHAPWRLSVRIARRGAGYEGVAELRDVLGAVTWSRPLAPRARCFDLVEDLAVALALEINPPVLPPASPNLQPEQPFKLEQPSSAQPKLEPARDPSRFTLRVGATPWMDLASAPRPAFGLTADVGFRVAWFSLAGEIHWNPPAGASVMNGVDVSTARLMGALVPCGHLGSFAGGGSFFGCVVGELGQIRGTLASTRRVSPDQQAIVYGTVGGRIGVEIPVMHDRLFVRIAANLLGVPRRPRFLVGAQGETLETAWESPAFAGGFGAGLFAAF